MGYYTKVSMNVRVKPEMRAHFMQDLEAMIKDTDIYWHYNDLYMLTDGRLCIENEVRKFYYEEDLVRWLSPYVEDDSPYPV